MNIKDSIEVIFRVTVLLIIWAVICITAMPERSDILDAKIQENPKIEQLVDYLTLK
ncbi:MAG: hypothetical protein ACFB15_05870 [Cyclobacteriaceae bacterium]